MVFGANLLQDFKEETVSDPYNLKYDQYDIYHIYIAIHIYADKLYLYSHTHIYIKMCSLFGENALEYTSQFLNCYPYVASS